MIHLKHDVPQQHSEDLGSLQLHEIILRVKDTAQGSDPDKVRGPDIPYRSKGPYGSSGSVCEAFVNNGIRSS